MEMPQFFIQLKYEIQGKLQEFFIIFPCLISSKGSCFYKNSLKFHRFFHSGVEWEMEIEHTGSHMPGKCVTTEPYPESNITLLIIAIYLAFILQNLTFKK